MSFDQRIEAKKIEIAEARVREVDREREKRFSRLKRGSILRQARRELLDLTGVVYEGLVDGKINHDVLAVSRTKTYRREFPHVFKKQPHMEEEELARGWILRRDSHRSGVQTMFSLGSDNYGAMISGNGDLLTFNIPRMPGIILSPMGTRNDAIGNFPSADRQKNIHRFTKLEIHPTPHHQPEREFGVFMDLYPEEMATTHPHLTTRLTEELHANNAPDSDREFKDKLAIENGLLNGVVTIAAIHGITTDII